jgi:DNA-binding transcriptional LysR family regulator
MNNDINWENLKFFIALATTGRLQKAAKELGSNHSTVYRRVKSFEEEISTKLFNSTPTGYILTVAGEKLLENVGDLQEKMDEISRTIPGIDDTLKGSVSITTTSSIAETILPKILLKFKKKWPELSITLKVSNQHFNLSKREADIAIRPSSKVPDHLIGRKLGYLNFGVYGAKTYLKNKPKNNFLKNIYQFDILGLDDELSHLESKQWLDKLIEKDLNIYRVDKLTTLASFCSEGLGIAVLPDYFCLKHKNLELLYAPKNKIGSDLWLLTHKDISKGPKIKITMDFLANEIQNSLREFFK